MKFFRFMFDLLANSAQVLVWRPTSGQPTLVVPPKSIEINTTNCELLLIFVAESPMTEDLFVS